MLLISPLRAQLSARPLSTACFLPPVPLRPRTGGSGGRRETVGGERARREIRRRGGTERAMTDEAT